MRKSILFVINSLGCGGAEKSLLSLLSLLDYDKYDVTLQMFRRGGMFEELLSPEVHVRKELDYTAFCSQSLAKQMLSFDLRRIAARVRTSLFLRSNAKRAARCMTRKPTGNIPLRRMTRCRNGMMWRLHGVRERQPTLWRKRFGPRRSLRGSM